MRKAARAVTQLYDKTLEPSGLQITQFTLLVALSLSEQLTVSQVAERLVMDRATLTRNVAPLERDGLVTRERGPDRRERYLRVTPAGRRALERALPLWRRAQAQVVTAIGQDTWHALRDGLQAFTSAVRDAPVPAGLGDVAVGVAAVFVLQAMLYGHPNWRRRVRLLNLGGLPDFVGAITTGVLTSTSSFGVFAPATPMPSMGMMPLSLVPSFLVPLWTIIHFASLLQLRETRGEAVRVS